MMVVICEEIVGRNDDTGTSSETKKKKVDRIAVIGPIVCL